MPYPMADGRWRAAKMINGKRKTKVCATKEAAKKWEAAQTEAGWAKAEEKVVTVFDWREAYLDYAKERFVHGTYEEKRAAFKQLGKFVQDGSPAGSIQPSNALAAIGNKALSVSGCRANRDRKNLSAAWSWGARYLGLPETNPFAKVDRFPEVRSPRYIPPEADFWRVCDHFIKPEHRAFVLLMLYTSARRGELLRLMWQDIEIENSRIRLHTRKRKGGQLEADWLPLVEPAKEILRGLPRRSMLVFPNPDGEQFVSRHLLMAGACLRAGVHKFGFHAVRHLSATILARSGVPVAIIQKILRHKNSRTTDIYLTSLGVLLPELNPVWDNREKEVLHKISHMGNFKK